MQKPTWEILTSPVRLTWEIEQLQADKQRICLQQQPNLDGVRVQTSNVSDSTSEAATSIADIDSKIADLRGVLLDNIIIIFPYIDSYPYDLKAALIGRYLMGWSVRQIAEVIKIPKSTVYQMLKDHKKTEGL
jgi:DNA-directed RNA polymerase specialized sigma24 family protein